jgi:hypothetical protein
MSVGCGTVALRLQPCHSRANDSNRATAVQLTLYPRKILNSVCTAPPEDQQVMLETCGGLQFSKN